MLVSAMFISSFLNPTLVAAAAAAAADDDDCFSANCTNTQDYSHTKRLLSNSNMTLKTGEQ